MRSGNHQRGDLSPRRQRAAPGWDGKSEILRHQRGESAGLRHNRKSLPMGRERILPTQVTNIWILDLGFCISECDVFVCRRADSGGIRSHQQHGKPVSRSTRQKCRDGSPCDGQPRTSGPLGNLPLGQGGSRSLTVPGFSNVEDRRRMGKAPHPSVGRRTPSPLGEGKSTSGRASRARAFPSPSGGDTGRGTTRGAPRFAGRGGEGSPACHGPFEGPAS